jgi:oligoribonuclease NrnB/cAMP/cGMP phosphodiesterase (DHH superfamily)
MKCFYHDDNDGKAAAAIVGYLCGRLGKPNPQYIPMSYSTVFPLETVTFDEEIWIVDYSIDPIVMSALRVLTHNVHWIDHHKSAIEKYAGYSQVLEGIRRDDIAACALTWEYAQSLIAVEEGANYSPAPLPRGIALIADRDVWRFKYGDETRQFHEGSHTYNTLPESGFWVRCIEDYESFLDEVIARGASVLLYKTQQTAENLKKLSYEVRFQDNICLAMNMQERSSEGFGPDSEALLVQYPILIAYTHGRNGFQVSLYSKRLDVAAIAEELGGGGHRGAAGFSAQLAPWIPLKVQ